MLSVWLGCQHVANVGLIEQPYVVGRAETLRTLGLRLDDRRVSSTHLTFHFNSSTGVAYAVDSSTNGTWVNGVKMQKNCRWHCLMGTSSVLSLS